jgi:diaminohydroxyphosphoribosylaminopyrimidine deaminase/5-amino-6-(5-phosphoribosylamino)uracil reductase
MSAAHEPGDARWMRLALEQGRQGVGRTHPNPPVGAVIVAGGECIGQGWHRRAGEPHAEIEALRDATARHPQRLRGATIYITLEPCSTRGRTGPCTEALIAAGLSRVVWGARDPNPQHAGRAETLLRTAGLAVTTGVLEADCRELIRAFAKWITTGLPWVIAKAATSLDGRLTRPAGEGPWLTSEAARAHGRGLRRRVDAILVGAETVRQDDPQLTIREGPDDDRPQPWRVVLSRSGQLPAGARLFTDAHRDRTLVLPGPHLDTALRDLGARGITSVLIEGGGSVLGQAFAQRLVDEVHWYLAPRLCGTGTVPALGDAPWAASVALTDVRFEPLGDNLCLTARPVWPATQETPS